MRTTHLATVLIFDRRKGQPRTIRVRVSAPDDNTARTRALARAASDYWCDALEVTSLATIGG